MQREIVLDTETTGLDARNGDRIIEIGCVEILNRIPTGREFHCFINPERDVPAEAERVHGISSAFLVDKPVFAKIAAGFLEFIGEDTLVIHNAQFDIGFLNAELARVKKPALSFERVVDTLQLARRKHPAGPNTLDGLCKRYQIDNSKRTKHGALMDSVLLADVYVELLGERQAMLGLSRSNGAGSSNGGRRRVTAAAQRPAQLPSRLSADDIAAHRTFAEGLGANSMWRKFFDSP